MDNTSSDEPLESSEGGGLANRQLSDRSVCGLAEAEAVTVTRLFSIFDRSSGAEEPKSR